MKRAELKQLELPKRVRTGSHPAGRAAVALLLAVVAVWSAALLLTSLHLVEPGQLVGRTEWAQRLIGFTGELVLYQRVLAASGAAAVGALAMVLLVKQLSPSQVEGRHVLVADEQGFVMIDTKGIETIATVAALRATGVVDAEVRVTGAGSAPVHLDALVGVHVGASVEQSGRETRERMRDAVQRLVGIPVSDVIVDVRVLHPDELARGLVA